MVTNQSLNFTFHNFMDKKKIKNIVLKKEVKTKKNEKTVKPEYPEPNIHNELHIENKYLKMKVHLDKIPMKFINFDAKEDKFTLETLKYTKKFFVE